MTLAYLTTPLLGLVDTAVIGQFGDAALLGGLAAGALVFDVVFTTFNFLRSGTTGLVAQAFGRADAVEEQAVFWRAALLACFVGLMLMVAAPLVSLAGQWFMGADPRVNEAMDVYIRTRMLGAPLSLLNYAILGYVLGAARAGSGSPCNWCSTGLISAFPSCSGSNSAGGRRRRLGTVGGEFCAALLGMAVLARRFRGMPRVPKARLFDFAAFARLMALNRDIMIRSFSLLAAFALFTRQGAQFGTVTLAANAVLMNFFMASSFFLDGFATAAEQLAGRAIGARAETAFRQAVSLTLLWGFGLAATATLVVFLAGGSLIDLITTAPDVRATAAIYLPWAALTALSGVLAFEMDGIFIGAIWSRDMRNMMLFALAIFVAALFALAPLGNHGLWAALHLFLLTRGFSLLAILRRRLRTAFA